MPCCVLLLVPVLQVVAQERGGKPRTRHQNGVPPGLWGSLLMPQIRIGTSGFHYSHWVGPFYPAGMKPAEFLPFYMQRFDAVEINNTFYRLPRREMLEAWRARTPPEF